MRFVDVFVPVSQEQIVEVPKIEYVDKIVEVPQVKKVTKYVEVPEIKYVDKVVDVPKIVCIEKVIEICRDSHEQVHEDAEVQYVESGREERKAPVEVEQVYV